MRRLKVAVIGAGHLGRIHARLVKQLEGVELVGIADPSEPARRQSAAECEAEAFASYHDLIGRVDAAVVATPTRLHHLVGMDLLRAGIHVLMEKPIAATVAEAQELVDAAGAAGVVLQVGHIERFNPGLRAIRSSIGAPKYIEAARYSGYTFRSTDIGVVHDLMIHDLDVVLSLVQSEVRDVEALGLSVMGGHEDVAQARLTFSSGCVANLSASRVSYAPARQMQVWSREAFGSVDFSTRTATIVRPGEALRSGTFDGEALSGEQKAHLKDHLFEQLLPLEKVEADATNALLDELRDFADSIRTGRQPQVTGEHGRDALAVAQRILDKIATHAWDAAESGPVGPLAMPRQSILRGPHWKDQPQPSEFELGIRREAS